MSRIILDKLNSRGILVLIEKLLKGYISRCKLKHSLAFFQFRKLLTGAKLTEIKELFE
jgi:hypothetical protein